MQSKNLKPTSLVTWSFLQNYLPLQVIQALKLQGILPCKQTNKFSLVIWLKLPASASHSSLAKNPFLPFCKQLLLFRSLLHCSYASSFNWAMQLQDLFSLSDFPIYGLLHIQQQKLKVWKAGWKYQIPPAGLISAGKMLVNVRRACCSASLLCLNRG